MKAIHWFCCAILFCSSACSISLQLPSSSSEKELSPQEMQMKRVQAGKPGKEHNLLRPLVGQWETKTVFYQGPEQVAHRSRGFAQVSWVLGGRFIQEEYRGEAMGKPFQGLGFTGFDNTKGKYVSVWLDSMSTNVYLSEGVYDKKDEAIRWRSEHVDPATGEKKSTRAVSTFVGEDMHIFEMYDSAPNGKEYLALSIEYIRNSGE